MKNLKSVKIVKNTIDEMYNAMTCVSKEDIDVILRINPVIQTDLEQLKKLFESDTITEIEPVIVKQPKPVVVKEEETPTQVEEQIIETPEPKEVAPKVTVTASSDWLKYKPDVVWKKDMGQSSKRFKEGLMVSNEGDIWDIMHNQLLEGKFLDCEMKVLIKKDCYVNPEPEDSHVRIAPIVCRAFGINSNTKNSSTATKVIIDYIDGDRRNLRPENLKWVKTISYPNKSKILAEDVCRRLVEAKGDIDATMKRYSDSTITRGYISNIRNKLIETALSSKFFYIENGKFRAVNTDTNVKPADSKSKKVSASASSYEFTNEPIEMLENSIRKGTLTIGEKNLMIVKTIEELQGGNTSKKITAEDIVDSIRDKWKISLPTDMAQTILNIGGIK